MKNKIIKKNKKYSYKILKADLDFLKFEYPYMYIGEIGESTLGEKIKFVKIGQGTKKIMITVSHNANEWITSLILMMFLEKYLELYNKKTEIYKGYKIREIWENISIYIIPMTNPDGVNLNLKEKEIINNEKYRKMWIKNFNKLNKWESNIRGVDLNLNYPINLKISKKNKKTKPGLSNYAGPNPLSEKETQNIYNFTILHKFNLIISLQYISTKPMGYKEWFINTFNKNFYIIEIAKKEEKEKLLLKIEEIYNKVEDELFKIMEYYVEK